MKKLLKNTIQLAIALTFVFVSASSAYAAGGISPYGEHDPQDTSIIALEDTIAIASIGSFLTGLTFIASASTLKEKFGLTKAQV